MAHDNVFRPLLPPLSAVLHRMSRSDPRHFQIAALASLLAFNIGFIDFGARPWPSALAVAGSLATQIVCTRLFGLPHLDLRSPLITGLSLSLLLRADEPWVHALAAVIAISSKLVNVCARILWIAFGRSEPPLRTESTTLTSGVEFMCGLSAR